VEELGSENFCNFAALLQCMLQNKAGVLGCRSNISGFDKERNVD
jgi:hypothetical protein